MKEKLKELVLPFIILTVICAVLLSLTHSLTKEKIVDNRQKTILEIINDILPESYDNDLLDDVMEVREPDYFGSEDVVYVYRLRKDNDPLGVVLTPVIAKGYNGPVELAIGISSRGILTGVRVLNHRETEKLGDGIHQNNSHWILQFTHKSFDNPPREKWAVKSDGGEFDQLSGATISSRGVLNAVKNTLDYYELNKENLYR